MNFLDFLFPKHCYGCRQLGSYLCETCRKMILQKGEWSVSYKAFPFARRVVVTQYRGVVRKLLLDFKYNYTKAVADDLSQVVTDFLLAQKVTLPKAAVLVPVPMYWHKENTRGFNQVAEMGKLVAQKMNWDYCPDLLIKAKPTAPQAKLDKSARLNNLSGSFKYNSGSPIGSGMTPKTESTLILFDDVVTTGTTLREAGMVLREAGFKNLLALVLSG